MILEVLILRSKSESAEMVDFEINESDFDLIVKSMSPNLLQQITDERALNRLF
jgi:hypothetical protein